ncbi:MAG: CoA ester lyase [Bacteroidales bacterium]|nr:CoA ester lyase [Bacteroidales bacterium]
MKQKYQGKLIHRSLLFTAGHNKKYLEKSFTTDADAIVFDLEDAVPANKKEEARVVLREFLSNDLPDNRPIYVRINPIETGYTLLDIDATACSNINGFVYPMANKPEDLIAFDAQLALKEKILGLPSHHFDIIALIETPEGVLNVREIAKVSDRVVGLLFGSEDFLAEQEGRHGKDARGMGYPRHKVAITAKANNIMAIDSPYVHVGDFEGLKNHIEQAMDMGYEGMLVMSPRELEIIHQRYTPGEKEVENADHILRLSDEAAKNDKGIIIHNGIFVSPPTLKAAKKLIKRAEAIKDYLRFVKKNKT